MHHRHNALWRNQLHDLLSIVRDRGIQIDGQAEEKLLAYCLRVAAHAATHDLVSMRDIDHLVTKHVAASMGVLAVETPQAGQLWIDAGTGGGFPGMVLKICRPELQIVLLDSSQKKTAFLISTGEAMGLADLDVVCSRMEEPFAVKRRIADQSFDVVLMKAVAPLIRVIAWANSLCHPGSRLLVFKGPQWKQEVEQSRELMQRSRWAFEDLTQIPWSHSKILRLRKQ